MNGAVQVTAWASVPVALLLLAAGAIIVVGETGLLRLPTFYQRIRGPAITVTLGTGFIAAASMLYFSVLQSRFVLHELLIMAFVFMTAPIVAMVIMLAMMIRAAVYRDLRAKKGDTGIAAGEVYPPVRKDWNHEVNSPIRVAPGRAATACQNAGLAEIYTSNAGWKFIFTSGLRTAWHATPGDDG